MTRRRTSDVNPQTHLDKPRRLAGMAWVANYTDQDGKRRLKTFEREKDANAFLRRTVGRRAAR